MWSAIRPVAARNGLRIGTAATAEKTKVLGAAYGLAARTVASSSGLPISRVYAHPSCVSHLFTRGFAAAATAEPKAKTATTTPKKPAAKKPAAKKPAAKKRATKKKAAAKKPKAKKPKAKKKVVVRKRLTPEQKEATAVRSLKKKIHDLKKVALLKQPARQPDRSWIVYVAENTKGSTTASSEGGGKANLGKIMPELSQNFKTLSPLELQRLRDTADKNRQDNAAALKSWIESHSAAEIFNANRARQQLARLTKSKLKPRALADERLPKRPLRSFSLFTIERWESGDFAGRPLVEAAKQIGAEWKELPASERQKYDSQAKAESERYEREITGVVGASPTSA